MPRNGNVESWRYGFTSDSDGCARPGAGDGAAKVADELFALALRVGGTISGGHGVGATKAHWLERQLGPKAYELHTAIKHAFDPLNLLNPGKKA